MSAPIRVLVADDHMIVRTGIRHVLESDSGFEVVGEAANGAETLTLAAQLKPDVVVLDISMPGESGLKLAAQLRAGPTDRRVLILSMHDNPEYVLESVRAGANGYLLKDTAATELRNAIRAVCRGESYFSPPIAGRLREALRGEHPTPAASLDHLTGREREVLLGVAQGKTNKEIATDLGISHRTVETHRESLMKKLQIRTIAELTRFALAAGIMKD
ncbi:MAG TPA: response regulator transcription factor [Gemmatimonadales bacterium]